MVSVSQTLIGVLFAFYTLTRARHQLAFGASNPRHRSTGGDSVNRNSNDNHTRTSNGNSTSSNFFLLQPATSRGSQLPNVFPLSLQTSKSVKQKQHSNTSRKVKRGKGRLESSLQNYEYHHGHQTSGSGSEVSVSRNRGTAGKGGVSHPLESSGPHHHHVFEHQPQLSHQTDLGHYPIDDHHAAHSHHRPHGIHHEAFPHAHEEYGGSNVNFGHFPHSPYQPVTSVVTRPTRRRKGFTHRFDFFGTDDPWALFGIVACIMLALPLVKAVITLPLANVLNNASRLAYLAFLNRNTTRVFGLRSIDGIGQVDLRDLIENEIDSDVPMDWEQFLAMLKEIAGEAITNKW